MKPLQLDRLADEEVASAVGVSPHEAFDVLFERYRGPVHAFITRQVKDRSRVDDLFQNTFIKMFKALSTYRRDATFKTWLFTIASHVVIDARRREARHEPAMEIVEDAAIAAPGPAPSFQHEEAVDLLKKAMQDLSAEHQQLFLLVRFHDMKIADAAVAVGLSPGSAKVTLFRIQQKLGRALESRLKASAG